MLPKLKPEQLLTIEEFLAMYEERPDGEKWELIEGVAVMSPSPVDIHQIIVANLMIELGNIERRQRATRVGAELRTVTRGARRAERSGSPSTARSSASGSCSPRRKVSTKSALRFRA